MGEKTQMARDCEKISIKFFKKHSEHRRNVRQLSEADNPRLLEARDNIISAIVSQQQRIQGRQYKPEDHRMHLIAQLIQGMDICYVSIVEGLLPQAAALQKQQIEAITALEEIEKGRRKDGGTPNVQNSGPPGFYEQYKAINDAAHPGNAEVIEALSHFEDNNSQGPTTAPLYRAEQCRILLANHCVYVLHLWRHASRAFEAVLGEKCSKKEHGLVMDAMNSLLADGHISDNRKNK